MITAPLTNKAYGYPTRGSRRRRKPTILACLHQTANAKAVAESGGALLTEEAGLTAARLADLLRPLCGDPARLEAMRASLRRLPVSGAAGRLADLVEQAGTNR